MPINAIILVIVATVMLFVSVYLIVLMVKALKRFILSKEVRKDKNQTVKSLGEAIKKHRIDCKMTQEFVAESLGVSRQAVSKWESGTSDPSTANLIALAKLFSISAESLLNEITS